MRWILGLLFVLIPGCIAAGFIWSVLHQDDANRHFVPVEAVVQSTEVRAHSGKSTTYSPEATYTYAFNGQPYQSTKVVAVTLSSDSAWAHDMLERIERTGQAGPEVGFKATAYVNRADPSDAILVRWYSFFPYGFAMGALFGTMLGAGILAGVVGGGRKTMAAVALDDSGWQLLLPRQNLRRQFGNSVAWLIGVMIAMLPLPAHWMFVAGQHGPMAWFAWLWAAGAIGLIGVLVFRRWSVSRHMSDARLRVRPVPLKVGEVFAIEAEADALSPLRVQEMTAAVVCIEHYREKSGNKTSYGTRTEREEKLKLAGATQVAAGEVVGGKVEVTLSDCPPTTDKMNYPFYTWEIRVTVKLEGMPDYAAVFPLEAL